MRKTTVVLLLAVCLHLGAWAGSAQQTKNALTNSDVVKMVRAGLDETTIILSIKQSATEFDISPRALIELKELGVSQEILEAMLRPESAVPETAPNEVYLIDGNQRNLMLRGKAFPTYDSHLFGKHKSFITIDGLSSALRVSGRKPVFEISLPSDVRPANNFILITFTPKSGRRVVERGKSSIAGSRIGYQPEAVNPTTFEEVRTYLTPNGEKYILYRVTVVNPLPPGEYAFAPQCNFFSYYDFGIEGERP